MKQSMHAGIIAGAVAVTAGGGVGIVAEGWPEGVLVAVAVAGAFRLGSWLADRRVAALVAVVQSFCEEAAVYYRARKDGEIDTAEAQELANAVDRFFVELEAAGGVLVEEVPCRTP